MTKPWTDEDVIAWKQACEAHGVDPILLLKCIAHESGADPAAIHSYRDAHGGLHDGAAGLIQVMPDNLGPLGFHGSPRQFAALTVARQAPFVGRFLGWFKAVRGKGLRGVYCCLFLPAYIDVAEEQPRKALCGAAGPRATDYAANINFDTTDEHGHRKGFICGADLERAAEVAFSQCPVAQDVARRLEAMRAPPASPPPPNV